MNITFLIGNGFDLNLKLKTRYSDFYEYYIENDPNDLLSKSIKSDYEMWSDLELGIGKFLETIDEGQVEEFLDSKRTLERMLSEYLALESKRFVVENEDALNEEFRKNVLNFFSGFNAYEKEHYHEVIAKTNEIIKYSFITFNYTTVLDDIVVSAKNKCKPFGTHNSAGIGYHDIVGVPHHIHGKLSEDLILGLDNVEQILNDKLKRNPKLSKYIIKAAVNTALGERKIEIAKEIIDKSRYVCLFGLSIGDTDGMWWKYIIEWLLRDERNRLVLFVNEKAIVQLSGQEKLRFRDLKRELMLERSQCESSETRTKIEDKIIVISNSNIFTLENCRVLEKGVSEKQNGD